MTISEVMFRRARQSSCFGLEALNKVYIPICVSDPEINNVGESMGLNFTCACLVIQSCLTLQPHGL